MAQLDAENKRLKISMEELRERLDTLQAAAGVDCPLCGQALTKDHRHDLLASLEQEGKSLADLHRTNLQLISQKMEEKTTWKAV